MKDKKKKRAGDEKSKERDQIHQMQWSICRLRRRRHKRKSCDSFSRSFAWIYLCILSSFIVSNWKSGANEESKKSLCDLFTDNIFAPLRFLTSRELERTKHVQWLQRVFLILKELMTDRGRGEIYLERSYLQRFNDRQRILEGFNVGLKERKESLDEESTVSWQNPRHSEKDGKRLRRRQQVWVRACLTGRCEECRNKEKNKEKEREN